MPYISAAWGSLAPQGATHMLSMPDIKQWQALPPTSPVPLRPWEQIPFGWHPGHLMESPRGCGLQLACLALSKQGSGPDPPAGRCV